jgi:hypothetical protein
MVKILEKPKSRVKFDYYNFFKWLSIGFTIVGIGIAIAIILIITTGKRAF